MHIRRLMLAAGTATAIILAVPTTALAASRPSHPKPTIHAHVVGMQVIPAFDRDLPLAKTGYDPSTATKKPAASEAVTPDQAFSCTIYASDPYVEDGTTSAAYVMGGDGFQSCSGVGWQNQRISVAIQTYIGLGFWDNRVVVPTDWSSSPFVEESAFWPCDGSGTQTYRIVTTGWAASGDYGASVQSLNDLRVTCAA